ncbi:MAG TPA: hypothetical protein VNF47_23135 [Streptosporangiaceae bacterium]|nr:hypothetical protein [Streptosporangiaceae bacterium]
MSTDVLAAERESEQARADVRAAEADIASGKRKIGHGKLIDLVTRARAR